MTRNELVEALRKLLLPERVQRLDHDFLEFELEMGKESDLQALLKAAGKITLTNPSNSCLVYALGISNQFDFKQARAHTIGGSPPDIDTDFEAMGRDRAVELVAQKWGRDNVANIITHGTFKPKSLTRRYFKITEGDPKLMGEILEKIPPPLFGAEATLQEVIEGKKEKSSDGTEREIWKPHPELRTDPRFQGWLTFTEHLEDMIANFGIHAAGVVISDFPIYQQIPMWKNSKAERITQMDMKEVEELGLIKFDFLSINNLDILKECVRLVHQRHGREYNPYQIPDGDQKAYELMHRGLLSGIFQMETSGSAKDLIVRIKPTSIEELSDISALNRPGPLENNFHEAYIANKAAGAPPKGMHPLVAKLTSNSYWTIVYQETVMAIVAEVGGFTLRESDDIRRGMGKKDIKVLEPYKAQFVNGAIDRHNMTKQYAEELWESLLRFSAYGLTE